jgi:LysR family glycine cleavage system transcriptional activator
MTEQSKNPQMGYATGTYPLADLTRPLPSLAGFQAFVAAASLGSVSKAADHLCRTQGAVSRQIQQLEAHYQCALFVRHASGLALTAERNTLLTVAVHVLTQLVQHAMRNGVVGLMVSGRRTSMLDRGLYSIHLN